MLVTLPVAFSLSRREFKARRIILFLFTFIMFFAGGLIPSYLLFKDLGILNLANTVGQVLAPVATGAIVVATGSYAQIFPVAIVSVLIGAVVIMLIKKVA